MIKAVIDRESLVRVINAHRPTPGRMEKIATHMQEQAFRRIDTRGASGGVPWPEFRWPQTNPHRLDERESQAQEWRTRSDDKTADVFNNYPFSLTHHFGAVIRPKRAKKLFVPLNQRAKQAYAEGQIRNVQTGKVQRTVDLKYGVDYLLLKSVTVPARPALPNSQGEMSDTAKYAMKVLAEP